LAHYRSGAGGTIPANKLIDNEIKKDKSYKQLINDMKAQIQNELKAVSLTKTSGVGSNSIKEYCSCTTLGSYGLTAKYNYKWTATAFKYGNGKYCRTVSTSPFTVPLSGYDIWDFEPNEGYGTIKNLLRETIPGIIASFRSNGKAKAFTINISFGIQSPKR